MYVDWIFVGGNCVLPGMDHDVVAMFCPMLSTIITLSLAIQFPPLSFPARMSMPSPMLSISCLKRGKLHRFGSYSRKNSTKIRPSVYDTCLCDYD